MRRVLVLLIVLACGRGDDPDVSRGPRVVSLTPSATEVVAALGAAALLVGVDQYSQFPPEVMKLPKVGDFLHPNLEAIVRLHPTLVVVDDIHGATADALHGVGIATVECAMHALSDVDAALRTVGAKLDRAAAADALVTSIAATVGLARAQRPAKHPRVLAIIDRGAGGLDNLVAAGPGSWLDDLLAVVGGDNALAGSAVRYPRISVEEVVRGQPDVIIDVSMADDAQQVWHDVDVPAAKAGHIYPLHDAYFMGPSPRVREALDKLRSIVAGR